MAKRATRPTIHPSRAVTNSANAVTPPERNPDRIGRPDDKDDCFSQHRSSTDPGHREERDAGHDQPVQRCGATVVG